MTRLIVLFALVCGIQGCRERGAEPQKTKPVPAPKISLASQHQAKLDTTQTTIKEVVNALEMYQSKKSAFPTKEQGLAVLVSEGFLAQMKQDAWGQALVYETKGQGSFSLKSLGADGKIGGKGFDADIELGY